MNSSLWIERLYNDEALTSNLGDDQAGPLLKWAEERLAACDSDEEATAVIVMLWDLNRRVGEGEDFAGLFHRLLSPSDSGDPPADPAPQTS